MAARLNKRHSDSCRQRIQTSQLLNRLQKHALGEIEMTTEQRDSAKFLISMSMSKPAQQIVQDITNRTVSELSDAEIDRRIAELTAGDQKTQKGQKKSTQVH